MEERTEGRVEFLGEQAGGAEADLQEALAPVLAGAGGVHRAYLARVRYSAEGVTAVALCIRSGDRKEALLDEIGRIFRSMFGRGAALDMMFVSERQEAALRKVCRPFFEASP